MSMADDVADLIGVWGAPSDGSGSALHTIVRPTIAFSDSGSSTPNFTEVDQQLGIVQSYRLKGDADTKEPGVESANEFLIVYPYGTNVQVNDRVQPPGWAAGQDDYYVLSVKPFPPSHIEVIVERVVGHAS